MVCKSTAMDLEGLKGENKRHDDLQASDSRVADWEGPTGNNGLSSQKEWFLVEVETGLVGFVNTSPSLHRSTSS